MESKTQWQILLAIIFGVLLLIPIGTLIYITPATALDAIIRLSALWGFVGLTVSSIVNLNKRILYQKFGLKFMQLHHGLAIFSLAMATLHPVAFAIKTMSILVFIPDFSSWYNFWLLGGRPALIILYIAVIAALFRKKSKKAWKYIHMLIYVVLVLILVHGIMIGTDFQSIIILILFSVLSLGAFLTFLYLRTNSLGILSKKKEK
ncbi:MAG: ferric reductase-like transmembrane domain-containing protein [Candidatus Lokiarchaeota archaeon]|nr:ferric reductase-like transmembrane domain-containing protein [Candidatus Lokiarchaeota archaeon]